MLQQGPKDLDNYFSSSPLFKPPKLSDPHSQLITLLLSLQKEPDHNNSHIPNTSSYLHIPMALSSTFPTYEADSQLDPIPSNLLNDITQAIIPSLMNLQCVSQLWIIPSDNFSQLKNYLLPLKPIPIISAFLCSPCKFLQRAHPPELPPHLQCQYSVLILYGLSGLFHIDDHPSSLKCFLQYF